MVRAINEATNVTIFVQTLFKRENHAINRIPEHNRANDHVNEVDRLPHHLFGNPRVKDTDGFIGGRSRVTWPSENSFPKMLAA
jgi:hypothetical protein